MVISQINIQPLTSELFIILKYKDIILSFIGIICLIVFLINIFAGKLGYYELRTDQTADQVIGCTHFEVEDVWVQNFPKLTTESAIRLIDINNDETLDVIIGFGTGNQIIIFLNQLFRKMN